MTLEELVEIAELAARSEGWQLGEPIGVIRRRRLFGADEYRVLGSAPARADAHAFVRICARSGDVLGTGWKAGEP
jgi:hypothetical protein